MLPFFSKGRSYLISTDESGGQGGVGGLPAACARGASAYGYSNIIDITDENNPRIVSKIMLEVHDPKNCSKFLTEPPEVGGGLLDYSTERCAIDRPINPTMAACGSRGTGTRVYDIRDPLHPAEIAYWKGPAPRTPFFLDQVAGHRASIGSSKSKLVWRALSKFLPLTGKGTS